MISKIIIIIYITFRQKKIHYNYHKKYWNTIPLYFHFFILGKNNALTQITTTIMTITETRPEAVATVIKIYIMKK